MLLYATDETEHCTIALHHFLESDPMKIPEIFSMLSSFMGDDIDSFFRYILNHFECFTYTCKRKCLKYMFSVLKAQASRNTISLLFLEIFQFIMDTHCHLAFSDKRWFQEGMFILYHNFNELHTPNFKEQMSEFILEAGDLEINIESDDDE